MPRLSLHRRHQRPYAHDIQDAREVVGEHVQRHFGGDARQGLHQKVSRSHPRLDRAEGMLDRLATHAHLTGARVKSTLYGLK